VGLNGARTGLCCQDEEEDGANVDLDSQRQGKCVVLKTSTRQTVFLPVVGLVPPDELKPGDLVRACLSPSRRGTA
jgi:hypothetical protein